LPKLVLEKNSDAAAATATNIGFCLTLHSYTCQQCLEHIYTCLMPIAP